LKVANARCRYRDTVAVIALSVLLSGVTDWSPDRMGASPELAATAGTAPGAQPWIRANLYHATVNGQATPGTDVVASLLAPGTGPVLADGTSRADASGAFQLVLRKSDGTAMRLAPGHRLLVSLASGPATTLLLPDMTASADVTGDTLSGLALPSAPVVVTIAGAAGAQIETIADAAGRFTVDFAGHVDVVPGTSGEIVAIRPDGHRIAMGWAAPCVAIALDQNQLVGIGPSGRAVSVHLTRSGYGLGWGDETIGDPLVEGSRDWSIVLHDQAAVATPVETGDRLIVVIADWALDVEVPALTIEASAVADSVAGVAPANAAVRVTARRAGQSASQSVRSGSDGRYVVDLAAVWDLRVGDKVAVAADLGEGEASVQRSDTVPGLTVTPQRGLVSGFAWPGATVTGSLSRPRGTSTATAQGSASLTGHFELRMQGSRGETVRPDAGDTLTVTYGTRVVTMTIPLLTVDCDTQADIIRGEATPGGTVSMSVMAPFDYPGNRHTQAAVISEVGHYSLRFAPDADLVAGTQIEATYTTLAGDELRIDRVLASVHVQEGGNLVSGFVAATSVVTVTVRHQDAAVGLASMSSGDDGAYQAVLTGGDGEPLPFGRGDVVTVAWSRSGGIPLGGGGIITHTVLALSASLDAATRTVSGRGPPNNTIYITMKGIDGSGNPLTLTAVSAPDGSYARDVPGATTGAPLPAGTVAEVGVLAPEGNRTYVRLVVPFMKVTMFRPDVHGLAEPLAQIGVTLVDGAITVGNAGAASDTFGRFTAMLVPHGAEPALVQAGRRLELREPSGVVTAVVIPGLGIDLDRASGVLRGQGPPGESLLLRLYPADRSPAELVIHVGDDGSWSLGSGDLPPGVGFTIADLRRAQAQASVGNGHLVIADTDSTPPPYPTLTVPPTATATATPTAQPSLTPSPSPTSTQQPLSAAYLPLLARWASLGR
jgi:hypothetical protein